jgi:hypothetical protein
MGLWARAALAAFAVAQAEPLSATEQPRQAVFVTGADAEIVPVATNRPNQEIRWVIKSEAGVIGQGVQGADGGGTLTLAVDLPSVTSPVQLALVLAPTERGESEPLITDLWVLPEDPFAMVRQTLAELTVVTCGSEPIVEVLKQSRIGYRAVDLVDAVPRTKDEIIVLGGRRSVGLDQFRSWMASLPDNTRLILIQNGEEGWGQSFEFLRPSASPDDPQWLFEVETPLWAGLEPQWLTGGACPSLGLTNADGLISFTLLGGCHGGQGATRPLAMEARDLGGRQLLIWNIPQPLGEADPRWGLVVRNSLIWARKKGDATETIR